MSRSSLYQGRDPRELPAYSVAEASRYVDVPAATLRSWFSGRTYPRVDGIGSFEPVLAPADRRTGQLSFRNVVEAHVLRALRTRSLFLEYYGELLHLDNSEQIAIRRVLESFLSRVDWDDRDIPIRLYPFLRGAESVSRSIVLDPQVSFGRPILVDSGISTSALVQRINAGEAIDAVARDYEITPTDVETAILFEKAA